MATVIKTVFTYPLDGTSRDFNIPFEYLARKFVVITLIGVDRKELVVTTDYRFSNRSTISLVKAWGPADGYQQIEVRRYTSATERLVDFADGSILRAYDLNVAQVQTLHVAEEARDLTADTIGVNNDGHLDARGRRIVNLADAVDPGDAVSMGQLVAWNGSALDSATKAKASEVVASQKRDEAVVAYNGAVQSGIAAGASATLASQWAANPVDVVVQGGLYSSYHWATKASGSAGNAASSSTQAGLYYDGARAFTAEAQDYRDASAVSAASAKADADRAVTANPDNQLKKANNLNDVSSVSAAKINLAIDRLSQAAGFTTIYTKSGQSGAYLDINENGEWGCYREGGIRSPLSVSAGGTGSNNPSDARTQLGAASSASFLSAIDSMRAAQMRRVTLYIGRLVSGASITVPGGDMQNRLVQFAAREGDTTGTLIYSNTTVIPAVGNQFTVNIAGWDYRFLLVSITGSSSVIQLVASGVGTSGITPSAIAQLDLVGQAASF